MSAANQIIVTIATDDAARRADAEALALRLKVKCVPDAEPSGLVGMRLRVLDDRLELADETMKPGAGVISELHGELHRLIRRPLTKRDPLRRALGKARGTIVDATAGLGTDAVRLATTAGETARIIAIERSPVIYALLEDGLRRARMVETWRDCIGDRFEIRHGDARDILPTIEPGLAVIYLDPMHPPKRRGSALPRKQMQMIRRVAGDDPDAESLLHAARSAAQHRVIVKRPDHAPPLAPNVTTSYVGKLVRFDVYVTTQK